ncbi:MAG: hypothetical protein GF398_16830 [Chitinivibrionales bacterium]|nr:hypothetical protein [Chitinivibrionales bacterium]
MSVYKDVTIAAHNSQGLTTYTATLFNCTPVYWTTMVDGSSQSANDVRLRLKIQRIEVSGPRQDVSQWLLDTMRGQDMYRDVAVTFFERDGSPGDEVTYLQCFITGYAFPDFDVSNESPITETLMFQPYLMSNQ